MQKTKTYKIFVLKQIIFHLITRIKPPISQMLFMKKVKLLNIPPINQTQISQV